MPAAKKSAAKKKAAPKLKLVASAHLDRLAPGDDVPDGYFSEEQAKRLLADGKLKAVEA